MQQGDEAGIERIRRMERAFDQAADACACGRLGDEARESIRQLENYMKSGQWLRDYERDELGLWPRDLKRGVLSQDALYDLLTRIGEEGE